ncbi:MAG: hypothetical protein ACYTGN_11375 [Planctomycetota bacterium]
MNRLALLLVVPLGLFLACGTNRPPPSPYLRIAAHDGRLYFADRRNLFRSTEGGFLSFYDLVTNEKVRLAEGTYHSADVPYSEVERVRNDYMMQPSKLPRVDDYPVQQPS